MAAAAAELQIESKEQVQVHEVLFISLGQLLLTYCTIGVSSLAAVIWRSFLSCSAWECGEMPLGFLSTFSLHAFFLMVGLMHHSLLRVGCFHIQRFWYYRAAGGERWSSSTSDDRNDLTISELLQGNSEQNKGRDLLNHPLNTIDKRRACPTQLFSPSDGSEMWRNRWMPDGCGQLWQCLHCSAAGRSGQGQLYCMDTEAQHARIWKGYWRMMISSTIVFIFSKNRTFRRNQGEFVKLIVYNLGYLPGDKKCNKKTDASIH